MAQTESMGLPPFQEGVVTDKASFDSPRTANRLA